MKAKAIIGLIVILLAIASASVWVRPPAEPIQVSGDLSKDEIADIRIAVHRKISPPLLPDLSLQSLRVAPRLFLQRFSRSKPKIWKVEERTHEFVAVIGRSPQDQQPRPVVFWGVFRETNNWRVEIEYHY
jgi:hypothetical protein